MERLLPELMIKVLLYGEDGHQAPNKFLLCIFNMRILLSNVFGFRYYPMMYLGC